MRDANNKASLLENKLSNIESENKQKIYEMQLQFEVKARKQMVIIYR